MEASSSPSMILSDSPPSENTQVTPAVERLKRTDRLWFEDGGVIIRAENTIFRVYREVLVRHSLAFRHLFQDSCPDEVMEGCPLLRLTDAANDMSYFLAALFEYGLFDPYPARTTLSILYGVLRLSHKYQVDILFKRALKHFSARYYTSFADWRARKSTLSWQHKGDYIPILSGSTGVCRLDDPYGSLPALPGPKGRTDYPRSSFRRVHSQTRPFPPDFRLESLRISTGRRDIPNVGLFVGARTCKNPHSCTMHRFRLHAIADRKRRADTEHLLPFDIWTKEDFKVCAKVICSMCMSAIQDSHQRALESLWEKLPGLCGLPGWEELEKRRREALN
ncbi:hypothetical protein C8R44DRAFT_698920 [Mycena epipterygia]|nr:hypothetical protein C8R44DRAFT_698920 [Mycena epipterygia]